MVSVKTPLNQELPAVVTPFAPAGSITARNVQDAIEQVSAVADAAAAVAAGAATRALDNLTGVAVNAALLPATNNLITLGDATHSWADVFLGDGSVINFNNGDVIITHAANALAFAGATVGYTFLGGPVSPSANDGAALGTGTLGWADLFLASGGVVNFANGDVTVTHAADTLAFAGAATAYTFAGGPVQPSANDGVALGTATVSWADLFLASGGVINFANGDVTLTHVGNTLTFAGATTNGYQFQDGPVRPVANDGVALGISGTAWADLFLASGGVINWSAGDVTITHATNALTFAGADNGFVFNSPVLMGTPGTAQTALVAPNLQLQGLTQENASSGQFLWNTTAGVSPAILLGRSRGATVGSNTVVQSGDRLMTLRAFGDDGAAFIAAASIHVEVDGTPGTNDMPGRLVFLTTADGAAASAERLRIGSTGAFTTPIANFGNFADDAAAAAGSVPIGGWYRTTSTLKVRVA